MADVFVSYSRRDSAFAHALAEALEARGKEPWLDVEGIEVGEVFPAVLRRAIEETGGMVFVISPEAARSPLCQQEVDYAQRLGKRIVPILHRPVPDEELPAGLRERQWVSAGEDLGQRRGRRARPRPRRRSGAHPPAHTAARADHRMGRRWAPARGAAARPGASGGSWSAPGCSRRSCSAWSSLRSPAGAMRSSPRRWRGRGRWRSRPSARSAVTPSLRCCSPAQR